MSNSVIDVGLPPTLLEPIPGVIPALEHFRDGKALVCQTTARKYDLPPPTVVIMDVRYIQFIQRHTLIKVWSTQPLATFVPATVKAAAGGAPIVRWMPCPMSGCLHLFGPEALGGHGDIDAKIAAIAKAQGKTEIEAADGLCERNEGAIITTPGVPALYDYEYQPQEVCPR
jgi:hypothetical protein